MGNWAHSTKYRHYIKKYPQGNTSFQQIDIEEQFKCRFQKMSNATQTGAKNVYIEDYAEHNGARIFVPTVIVYESSEIDLYLRWRSDECDDVLIESDNFFNYISGHKFEYHDTFRPNRYWQFVLKKAPAVQTEILNSDIQYLIIKYTLTNWGGKPYATSQL